MPPETGSKNILARFGQHTLGAYHAHELGMYSSPQQRRLHHKIAHALVLPALLGVISLGALSSVTVQSLLASVHTSSPTQVATQPKTLPKTITKPTTHKTAPKKKTTKPTTSPTYVVTPPPAPKPLPSMPAVAGKNTSYTLGVLVIKYFPLTSNGQNININVTGDVSDSYSYIRQHTTDVTNNLLADLPKATKYLGYHYGGNLPSLGYHVVATFEHKQAVPIDSTSHPDHPTAPNYNLIMTQHNICDYVNNKGVREVWLWAYQGPSTKGPNHDQPYLGISESKMSGPYGDISNSFRWNDMPLCAHTYRVYTFNYGRGTSEAMESWGHQMEAELDAVNQPLFRNIYQGPNYPQTLHVNGRCGSVHNPPNARSEYDRANSTPQLSDCLDWNPDGLGHLTSISCKLWGCYDYSDSNNSSLNYMIWMWQNLPGRNNTKSYQGQQLRNWWDVHGEFDTVMGSSKHLTL